MASDEAGGRVAASDEAVACLLKAANLLPGDGQWTDGKIAWHKRLANAAAGLLAEREALLARCAAAEALVAAVRAWATDPLGDGDEEAYRYRALAFEDKMIDALEAYDNARPGAGAAPGAGDPPEEAR